MGDEDNLQIYYDFNHGNANSDNSSFSTIPDRANNDQNGTLTNFALDGDQSNLTLCQLDLEECPKRFNFTCGMAVATCFSGFNASNYTSGVNTGGYVAGIYDVRDHSTASPGDYWSTASMGSIHHAGWTADNLGQIFGLAMDDNNMVYVTSTTVYGCENMISGNTYSPFGPAGEAGIYQLNPSTGAFSNFITTGAFAVGGTTIPNSGSGLGNITYDEDNDQFFVTNMADGMIYRIKNGQTMSRFDPFGTANAAASGTGSNGNFVERGERTWGVGYNENRVYFARWVEDNGRSNPTAKNEIYSIDLDGSGEFNTAGAGGTFATGETLEISLPDYPGGDYSNPVSDITFSKKGLMLVAERTMRTDCGGGFTNSWYSYAHRARVLEYENPTGTWQLTPGHTLPVSATNNNLKYRIGLNANANSAGGVTYSHESYDPNGNIDPECDQFIWASGDNLKYVTNDNTYCANNKIWVYGLQGTDANTGGTAGSSFLVDLDAYVCFHEKILLGDVEIAQCPCPEDDIVDCEDVDVDFKFDNTADAGECCWDIDLTNNYGNTLVQMEAVIITPGVIFDYTSLGAGYNWVGVQTPTLARYEYPGGIPMNSANAFHFCLGDIDAGEVPQIIEFRWYEEGPNGQRKWVCSERITLDCQPTPADDCWEILNAKFDCTDNPNEYKFTFDIKNLGIFNATTVELSNLTAGFGFKPFFPMIGGTGAPNYNVSIPPTPMGGTATNICVIIHTTIPITSPTSITFDVGLSGLNANQEYECCQFDLPFTGELKPCCEPCDDVIIRSVSFDDDLPNQDGDCCHRLDILDVCDDNFFTAIELKLSPAGVNFGSHIFGASGTGWIVTASSSNFIRLEHFTGTIPMGSYFDLLQFCLDDIQAGEVPQIVDVCLMTVNNSAQQEVVACSDRLIFDCPAPVDNDCLEVLESAINCNQQDPNKLDVTLTIQNNSQPANNATHLEIVSVITPAGIVAFPNSIDLGGVIPPGGTATVNTCLYTTSGFPAPGKNIKLELRLRDDSGDDAWCCIESDTLCLVMPNCCCELDPPQALTHPFVGQAVGTCRSGQLGPPYDTPYVIGRMDITNHPAAPVGSNWGSTSAPPLPMYHGPTDNWTVDNLGEVFGIALDLDGNIYTSATSIYAGAKQWGTAGDPSIYKIDVAGNISVFNSTLPNATGSSGFKPGFGNICYNYKADVFYVSNFEDGLIYVLDDNGVVIDTYDPIPTISDSSAGWTDAENRVFGLAYHKFENRLYYAVWNVDFGQPSNATDMKHNEIWSVDLDGVGEIAGTTNQMEIELPYYPGYPYRSGPVADISFSNDATQILLAERSMSNFYSSAHTSRLLSYQCDGSGSWVADPVDKYETGAIYGTNCAGGTDFAYGDQARTDCDQVVMATADAIILSGGVALYGAMGFPVAGGDVTNSFLIDYDDNTTGTDKTELGDIEIFRDPCCRAPIDEPCELTVIHEQELEGCVGDGVNLNPIIGGAVGAYTCVWMPSADFVDPNVCNAVFTIPTVGVHWVTLTVTDSKGCTATVRVKIVGQDCGGDNCCIDEELFCDEVNKGFNWSPVQNECGQIAVTPLGMFDECDEITWDWGDGTPPTVTTGPSSVLHTYANDGGYVICMTVRRYTPEGELCLEKRFCRDIYVKPCECLCDEKFYDDVAEGFDYRNNPLGDQCRKFSFRPKKMKDTDQVSWEIKNASGTVIGGGTGFTYMFTFPSNGNYEVCMYVQRNDVVNQVECKARRCMKIRVRCLNTGTVNDDPIDFNPIGNGGFGDGSIPGVLTEGGRADSWEATGAPILFPTIGCDDEFFVRLAGNAEEHDQLNQDLELMDGSIYRLQMCTRPIQLPPGSTLIAVLDGGDEVSQVVMTKSFPEGTPSEWETIYSNLFLPAYSTAQLQIYVVNGVVTPSPDDYTIIEIDNVQLQKMDYYCDDRDVAIMDAAETPFAGLNGYYAERNATSNAKFAPGSNTIIRAGNEVTLSAGFSTMPGAELLVTIEDCEMESIAPAIEFEVADRNDSVEEELVQVADIQLIAAPNPFRSQTDVFFHLPTAEAVYLNLFRADGSVVKTLVNGQIIAAGDHRYQLDGTNYPAGIYYLQLQTKDERKMQKLILLK
ncbi:MAG: T9SS type A sorting domain-containing protein [Saprospiraceae bacterium]